VFRVGTLLQEDATLAIALFALGIATLITGSIAMLSAKHLARLVSYSVLVSMGILLAAFGLRIETLTGPLLFYMIISVLTTSAFFMLTGMIDRMRFTEPAAPAEPAYLPPPAYIAYGIKEFTIYRASEDEAGVAIPAATAFLGMMFMFCVLLLTGIPPLPGFIAKFALLSTALQDTPGTSVPPTTWILFAAILLSGLAGIIALSRIGMQLFWSVAARATPRLRILEVAPIIVLVLLCVTLSVTAGPVAHYLDAAARSLHQPETYIRVVLAGAQVP
jgi:multicomponent K+:H+ antiporter subunit D